MVALVYTVRLATELTLLAGVAVGARHLSDGWLLAVVAVVIAAACWGVWIGPRSARRLPDPARLVTELALFAWGTSGFVIVGWVPFAIAFFVVAALAARAIRWTGEPIGPGSESDPRPSTR